MYLPLIKLYPLMKYAIKLLATLIFFQKKSLSTLCTISSCTWMSLNLKISSFATKNGKCLKDTAYFNVRLPSSSGLSLFSWGYFLIWMKKDHSSVQYKYEKCSYLLRASLPVNSHMQDILIQLKASPFNPFTHKVSIIYNQF